MKGINAYMKHVMEAADDAPLLYFGIPNKILTYSTVRNWFVKVTPKTLLLSSIWRLFFLYRRADGFAEQ